MAELPKVMFDVYLVPRIASIRRSMKTVPEANHVGVVTVDPAKMKAGQTALNHAIELVATHTPRVIGGEDI